MSAVAAESLALLALALFVVLNAITGIRLLRLASRTRQLPEFALGAGHLFGGSLGWALIMIGYVIMAQLHARGAGLAVMVAGMFCLDVANVALALFAWRVFNPRAGGLAVALFVLLTACSPSTSCTTASSSTSSRRRPRSVLVLAGLPGAQRHLSWLAVVTLLYPAQAAPAVCPRPRRRGQTTNRMFLLFLSSIFVVLLASVVTLASNVGWWTAHPNLMGVVSSLLGLPSAVCSLLAFVPPRRYTEWVARRAPVVAE